MKRTISAMIILVIGGVLVTLAPPASAQTGYPIAGCSPADTVFDAGTHDIGETFTVRLVPICLWDVGSDVATTANGQSVGTRVADAGGGVNVGVTVVSATQLSINPLVASQCGENSVSGIGPSAAAQTMVRSTAIFRVRCDGAAAAPRTARGGVAFTGANLVRSGVVAIALLGLGSLLVAGARRRRGTAGNA